MMPENLLAEWLGGSEPAPLDDEHPPGRSRRLSAVLAALAGLWLGLLVVAWQALGAPAPGPPPGPPVGARALPAELPAEGPDELQVTAHALLAVRTKTAEHAGPGGRRYADLAVAEAVDWTGPAAVVTVLVYLLEGDDSRWSSARTARYGVAVSVREGSVVTDAVWPLAPPAQDGGAWDWEPVAGRELADAARAALEAAGYRDVQDPELATDERLAGVLRATVTAIAPGEGQLRTHEVWLDGAGAAVLGRRG